MVSQSIKEKHFESLIDVLDEFLVMRLAEGFIDINNKDFQFHSQLLQRDIGYGEEALRGFWAVI